MRCRNVIFYILLMLLCNQCFATEWFLSTVDGGDRNEIKNALILNNKDHWPSILIDSEMQVTSDYNNLFNSEQFNCQLDDTVYTSLSVWQTATGQDAHSITSDPLLMPDGLLMPGSPCIGAGTQLDEVTDDFDGIARNGRNDIGARQFRKAYINNGVIRG